MSKISYCSIEEAWGTSFDRQKNNNNPQISNDSNENMFNRNKYDMLNEKSKVERENVINNMNNIERNAKTENNMNIQQYNKYRFNPNNTVSNNSTSVENARSNTYSPFSESIEKKQLKDKLDFLENEFKKYKYMLEPSQQSQFSGDYKENFQNENDSSTTPVILTNNNGNDSNDFIDLILLIIIGLIVILVLNSIFNIGKAIGARGKS